MAGNVQAYLIRDDDPDGGYFSLSTTKPDLRHFPRRSIAEIRLVEIPDYLPDWCERAMLPVDPDGSTDSTWSPYWAEGTTVWLRGASTDPRG